MPFCSQCGTKNEEGARFCLHCGAALVPSQPVPSVSRKSTLLPFGGIIFAAIIMIVAIVLWASFSEVSVVPREPSSKFREGEGGVAFNCRKVIENLLAYDDLEDKVRVISLTVTKSYEKEMLGAEVRSVEFETELEYLSDIGYYGESVGKWIGAEFFSGKNMESAAATSFASLRLDILEAGPAGERKILSGVIDFHKTNKGWLGPDGELY